ncbi:hypothetical protein [Rhizobium rhizogenes]|uniref:hypothetical protein n=1 Tax=Rhizobium rhizogenes TaxID=359 RepID=UPI0022B74C27|nr:hypothetical protein [Rhizobium rhizogenes]MCZ7448185.1 hypothetical protein [Rhizobium rhizogenes]MCZ7465846.1 hypothetical protein [Rhizobium rhizogenes]
MAKIIDFPSQRAGGVKEHVPLDNEDPVDVRFRKAADSLLGVLRQAERAQAAILAYQAVMKKNQSEMAPHAHSQDGVESPAPPRGLSQQQSPKFVG